MTDVCFTENRDLYEKIKARSLRYIPAPFEILRTENGKPYFKGDPLFFSLSHSGGKAVYALSDRAVGVDLELFKEREHSAVLGRFSEREQAEICGERDFLIHWTVREAFIKMKGETVATYLSRLEYFGGSIYLDGEAQDAEITLYEKDYGVAAVCAEK